MYLWICEIYVGIRNITVDFMTVIEWYAGYGIFWRKILLRKKEACS